VSLQLFDSWIRCINTVHTPVLIHIGKGGGGGEPVRRLEGR
jgi:hypothetical protein